MTKKVKEGLAKLFENYAISLMELFASYLMITGFAEVFWQVDWSDTAIVLIWAAILTIARAIENRIRK